MPEEFHTRWILLAARRLKNDPAISMQKLSHKIFIRNSLSDLSAEKKTGQSRTSKPLGIRHVHEALGDVT